MLPSRGLRPAHLTCQASRQTLHIRANGSRKFSSLPRTSLSVNKCRTNPIQAASWRTGAISPPNGLLSASSVRYGSWYAPWSWGNSSAPPADALPSVISSATPSATPSELSLNTPSSPEPVVTSNTPELAPAGIDKPAHIDGATSPESMTTIEELLADPNPVNKLPTPDASLTIDHYGQLKEMGLDYGWGPTAFFEWLIEHVHLMTGYGWGGSIIISTVVIRACLFWFQAQGSDNLGKLAAMKPVLESYQKKTEEAIQSGNSEQERLYKMKQQQIGQEIGVKLGKGFMGPIAIGVFGYGAFRCLRGMSTLPVPGMSEAGFLWFTDLTVGDPYYALPALTGALMWVVMKTGGEQGIQNHTAQASQQKMLMNIMPIGMALITMLQPATIQFYFFCSSTLGLLTGRALRSPYVRRVMRISALPTKESHEVFSKIIQEKKPLQSIRGKDGKIVYQAPITPSSNVNRPSGLNLKPGTKIPGHYAPVGSEKDKASLKMEEEFQRGMPKTDRTSWVATHYQPTAVIQRLRKTMSKPEAEPVLTEEKPKLRVKAGRRDFEAERRKFKKSK